MSARAKRRRGAEGEKERMPAARCRLNGRSLLNKRPPEAANSHWLKSLICPVIGSLPLL